MLNWDQTLLSQYCDSPTIKGILSSFNDAIDPSADLAQFYYNIFNVATAVGNGLDIWGAIVGVSRYLQISATPYLGFEEAYTAPTASTGPQPFNQAPFYNGVVATTTFALSDTQYRQLILVKAAAHISKHKYSIKNSFALCICCGVWICKSHSNPSAIWRESIAS